MWSTHSGLQLFESDGLLILLDNRSPDEREAYLNDHSFACDPLCLQLYSGYGYGVNYKTGYLDGKITDDGEFIPAPRNEATK